MHIVPNIGTLGHFPISPAKSVQSVNRRFPDSKKRNAKKKKKKRGREIIPNVLRNVSIRIVSLLCNNKNDDDEWTGVFLSFLFPLENRKLKYIWNR